MKQSGCRCSVWCALAVTWLLTLSIPARAETVYDNLTILDKCSEGPGGCWQGANRPDRRFAQQFLLGGNTVIDEVTVQLARTGNDVLGTLSIELWADDGQGDPLLPDDPNRLIAVIGEISDVKQMPRNRTNYSFDTFITGLAPDSPYWIVVNFEGMVASSNAGVGWGTTIWPLPAGVTESNEFMNSQGAFGTNGAVSGHLIRPPYNPGEWIELPDVFGGAPFGTESGYYVMAVSAVPEPTTSWLVAFATLTLTAFRRTDKFHQSQAAYRS